MIISDYQQSISRVLTEYQQMTSSSGPLGGLGRCCWYSVGTLFVHCWYPVGIWVAVGGGWWVVGGATRRNHFSTMLIHFVKFKKIIKNIVKQTFFPIIVSPGRELWHWRRDGDRGDHLGPQISNKTQTNPSYENCSHFWDIFHKNEYISRHIFKICSYIRKIQRIG